MSEVLNLMRQAEQLLAERSFSEVESLLSSALEQHADEGQLWRLLALARHAHGDFGSAAMAFEQAGMLVPLSARDQCLLAECYATTDRARHAVNIYQHLLEDPNCPREMLPTIAAGFGRLGDARAAMKVCRLALQSDPDRPEPLFGLVYYLRKLGYPAKVVIPLMRRAFEMASECTLYRSTLAFLLAEDGRTEDAYDLLCDLRPAEAGCARQVRRMMAIFQAVGDFDRWKACRQRLEESS